MIDRSIHSTLDEIAAKIKLQEKRHTLRVQLRIKRLTLED